MGPAVVGSISTARGAPTPVRRCEGHMCVFTCNGCREVARLVGEVEQRRQMM